MRERGRANSDEAECGRGAGIFLTTDDFNGPTGFVRTFYGIPQRMRRLTWQAT